MAFTNYRREKTVHVTLNDVTIQQLFGHEAAEDEDITRLRSYYFKGKVFQRATADLPLRLLVGHKGIGKSALFQVARQEDIDEGCLAILLRPDDVYEISTTASDLLESIRNWKSGLCRIIYDKSIQAIGASEFVGAKQVGVSGQIIDALAKTFKPFLEKAADIDAAKQAMAKGFLSARKIRIYLDDLDRGWTASKESILRLSSLLNAARDLTKEHLGLQFRISLRSDVYYLVRTSDESTDKIEGSVVWYSWTNHEILAMLVKRMEAFFGRQHSEEDLVAMEQSTLAGRLETVLEPRFFGSGGWSNIPMYRMLMTLIKSSPRDLVKLCTSDGKKAYERN